MEMDMRNIGVVGWKKSYTTVISQIKTIICSGCWNASRKVPSRKKNGLEISKRDARIEASRKDFLL